jgi:hypothetical protein
MRLLIPLPWAVGILFAWCGSAGAQETPRAVIERAIAAHGGMDNLARARVDRVKLKGSVFVNGKTVPFTAETLVQLPDKLKTTLQTEVDNRTFTVVQVLNGEQAWTTLDGQPKPIEGPALAELRQTLQVARAMRLLPLLTDKNYTLGLLGESKVNDRVAIGVKVAAKGHKDLLLYFDKETNHLVKTEHTLDDGAGKEVKQEEFYSDFRDLGGFKRAVKMAAYRKGAKIMEAELVDVKYFSRFDDGEFGKP